MTGLEEGLLAIIAAGGSALVTGKVCVRKKVSDSQCKERRDSLKELIETKFENIDTRFDELRDLIKNK